MKILHTITFEKGQNNLISVVLNACVNKGNRNAKISQQNIHLRESVNGTVKLIS